MGIIIKNKKEKNFFNSTRDKKAKDKERRKMSNRRDDYKKVTKKGEKDPNQPNNLIKITTVPGRTGRYVGRAVHLFMEDKETAVYLRGAGNATPIAL